MTPYGYIQNTLKDGNVRSVFLRSMDNVYVQKILPSEKSYKRWDCHRRAILAAARHPEPHSRLSVGPPPSLSTADIKSSDALYSTKPCSIILEKLQGSSPSVTVSRSTAVVGGVDLDDDGEVHATEVDRNQRVPLGVKIRLTSRKQPPPSRSPSPTRRANQSGVKVLSAGENILEFEELNKEEVHSVKEGKGDMVRFPLIESPSPQPSSLLNRVITTKPLESVSDVLTLTSAGDKVPDAVKQPEAEEGLPLDEVLEQKDLRWTLITPSVPIGNETPPSAPSRKRRGSPETQISQSADVGNKGEEEEGNQLMTIVPPAQVADESQQWGDLDNPIWSQMIQMQHTSESQPQQVPTPPLESPSPERSQGVSEVEMTTSSVSATSTSATDSPSTPLEGPVGSSSQWNSSTQEESGDGVFTQLVAGVDSNSSNGDEVLPGILVANADEETTGVMHPRRTPPLLETFAGREVDNPKWSPPPPGFGEGSQHRTKRLRRTGMFQGTPGERKKPSFPAATYERISRKDYEGSDGGRHGRPAKEMESVGSEGEPHVLESPCTSPPNRIAAADAESPTAPNPEDITSKTLATHGLTDNPTPPN